MTTFRGADVIATFNDQVIGRLNPISYSVSRESAPRYYMGTPGHNSFSRGFTSEVTLSNVIADESQEQTRRNLIEHLDLSDDFTFSQLSNAVRLSYGYARGMGRGFPGNFRLQVDEVDYSMLYPATFSVIKVRALDFKKFIRPIEMDESKFTYVNPNNSFRSWKLNREEEVYYD
ncbi:hypothetical protein_gp277 [Bacillus phage vB_BceM_WH1]|nr:hypothetical protein_gp277 [Bacillus phage vB_BceM_WH1]